jgi:hypothetical protein
VTQNKKAMCCAHRFSVWARLSWGQEGMISLFHLMLARWDGGMGCQIKEGQGCLAVDENLAGAVGWNTCHGLPM